MLYEYFLSHIAHWRTKIAVSLPDWEIPFQELFNRADRLASQLEQAGVAAGDIVVVSLPNSAEFLFAVLALWKLGAVVALASPKYGSSEIENIHQHLPFTHAITHSDSQQNWDAGKSAKKQLTDTLTLSANTSRAVHRVDIPQLAVIKFSSGTTGIPKGIALTADNLIAETEGIVQGVSLSPDDRILTATPLFHSYGFDVGLLAILGSGATLYIRDMFIPRLTLKEIDTHAITHFLGVPSMYRAWCDTRITEKPSLKSLKYALSCTAPLPPSVITQFHERFGVPICQHYGSSETGAVSTHAPLMILKKPTSVGRTMPHVEIRIVDDTGASVTTQIAGEVIVSGKAVAAGYLMGAPSKKTTLSGGEFKTGDLGFLDAEGYLYITGRIDDCINVGGFKVSPLEVSHVLEEHSAVRAAAVTGQIDASGEIWVHAAVVLDTAASEDELLTFCRTRLAEYKIPRRIDIVDELPIPHQESYR